MAQLQQKGGGSRQSSNQGVSVVELSPAEAAKDAGNAAFKVGDYKKVRLRLLRALAPPPPVLPPSPAPLVSASVHLHPLFHPR